MAYYVRSQEIIFQNMHNNSPAESLDNLLRDADLSEGDRAQ